MTRCLLHCITAALLASCATQQPMIWDKQGWNQKDYAADEGQCKAQALSVPGAMAPGQAAQVAAVFGSCMQGKGYYQRPAY